MASMRTSTPWPKWKLGAFVATAIATLVAACGNSAPPLDGPGNGGPSDASICIAGHPQEGCPCAPNGGTAACGEVIGQGQGPGVVACGQGTATCVNGQWSACLNETMSFKSTRPLTLSSDGSGTVSEGPTRHPEALGMSTDAGDAGDAGQTICVNNPCDPQCTTFVDNSNGVDGGPGLVPTDSGGWTLAGDSGGTLEASTQCFVNLTGTVYDPAALEPVYNAVVAIPFAGNPVGSGSPPAISTGVPLTSACGGNTFPALRAAYTDVNGKFTLQGVPVQSTVTVVVQIGRWRRLVTVNTSTCACGATINISTPSTNTCLGTVPTCAGTNNYSGSASCLTRLPRTQSEGNIPHIAIGTGSLDAIECMLYRMGVSSSEYTDETKTGRIHIFNDGGSKLGSGAANHDVSYLLGFACPGGNCPASTSTTNITNPGFDTNNTNGWTRTGSYANMWNGYSTSGNNSVSLGSGYFGTNCVSSGTNTLTQGPFTAPTGMTALAVDETEVCSGNGNYVQVSLKDNTSNTTQTCNNCNNDCNGGNGCEWETCTLNVTAGHSYTLALTNYNQAGSTCSMSFFDSARWIPTITPLLDNYDMVILPCDGGGEYDATNWAGGGEDQGRNNLVNYANVGGRVFTSHWGREWIERTGGANLLPNGPFPNVATWVGDNGPPGNPTSATGDINTGSTWGASFNSWMTAVSAAAGGQFTINPWREDTSAVSSASRLFVSYDGDNGTTQGYPADFTFDTPLGGSALGRVMFTDMHLANGNPSGTFPGNCPTQGTTLLSQEAAAEYLIFDLGSCVSGQPVPTNYPPISTTGNGTNSTCSGGTAKDINVGGSCSAVTGDPSGNSDCSMDFHCSASTSGTCTWSQGSGYYDANCLDTSGNPAIDLTVGVPCQHQVTAADGGIVTGYDIPLCNRGGGTLAANTAIDIGISGNGGNQSAPWVCTAGAPNSIGASCTYTTPMALGPGECIDIDTTSAGSPCLGLFTTPGPSSGERFIYVNYDEKVPECGLGFTGSGAGCDNNTTHTKTTGNGCPATCGSSTVYTSSSFTRDFQGVCQAGYRPVWKNFQWSGDTPNGSSLDFQAWTADSEAQLGVQYTTSATLESPAPDNTANGYVDTTLYGCTPAAGAPACTAAAAQCTSSPCACSTSPCASCCNSGSNPTIVDSKLVSAGYPTWGSSPGPYASHPWLRVKMTLNPSTNLQYAPTLLTWNQSYDCVPSE